LTVALSFARSLQIFVQSEKSDSLQNYLLHAEMPEQR